ncbi:MAG: marine proteobacterial sortase target protein [Alphaproteobacteria bacterium]|jgi:Ca-activated chloride channel family protein
MIRITSDNQLTTLINPLILKLTTLILLLILTAFIASSARAAGELPSVNRMEDVGQGSLLFKDKNGESPKIAPLVGTDVSIYVSGLVARAHVVQHFINPSDDWVEGVYVFPLPENAAVDDLTLRIGERIIEGRIEEREKARKTYETAKQEGKKSGLIESERPNIFTASIANIGPGEEISVEIEYQQILEYDQGHFSLRFPMVVGPRYIPGNIQTVSIDPGGWSAEVDKVPDASRITPPVLHPDQGNINPVRLTVTLDAGFPLATINSSYHLIDVDQSEEGHYIVTLADGAVPADRDFELVWTPDVGATPSASLFTEIIGGERYMLAMVMPPSATSADDRSVVLPREAIFVIDTSGSMSGDSIDQAKVALTLAIDRLKVGDRFNIIEFNSSHTALFHSPQPVDEGRRAEARRFIARLEADGGTEMAPALRQALAGDAPQGFLRQVVFLTDGAIGDDDKLISIIHQSLRGSRLFPIGIGSSPNSYFMREAAEAGRGSFTYIGDLNEVAEKMGVLFTKLESPLLADLQITWPEDVQAEISTEALADLYAGEPVIFTVRTALVGGDAILSGRLADRQWRVKLPLDSAASSPGIAKLWARDRIDDLINTARRGGDIETIRAQIVSLGLTHNLVTKYTSLVAVDATPTRPDDLPLASRQMPTNLPAGWDYDKTIDSSAPIAPQRKADASANPVLASFALASATSPVQIGGGGGLFLPRTATPAAFHLSAALALALFGLLALLVLRFTRKYV